MRNRQLVVHWLAGNTDAIDVSERDGKTYFRVKNVNAWHKGVGRLLHEVQRIKSEGDRNSAADLMNRYAIKINAKLRDEVLSRFEKLDHPSYTGFVMPEMMLIKNESGEITDVGISYPEDLETQMLRWTGRAE